MSTLGEEAKIDVMIEEALDEADESDLLEYIEKLEAQNKKLVEALKLCKQFIIEKTGSGNVIKLIDELGVE